MWRNEKYTNTSFLNYKTGNHLRRFGKQVENKSDFEVNYKMDETDLCFWEPDDAS
jgi:hypothetical protein